MHPDRKTMSIWQIDNITLHTTTEKSSEEWFNQVKLYIEAGWWPSDPKDIQFLENRGYKEPIIKWKNSEVIITRLNCLRLAKYPLPFTDKIQCLLANFLPPLF